MGKALMSPPKHIVKKIVLFSAHGHSNFVDVIVEQFRVFSRALTVLPLDEDNVLAVLVELLATFLIMHTGIIGMQPRVCDDAAHRPGRSIFWLQEIFFDET